MNLNNPHIRISVLALGFSFCLCAAISYIPTIASTSTTKSPVPLDDTTVNDLPSSIESLVPADGTTVDIMQPVAPDRLVELSQKFKAAVQRNPDREWLSTLVNKTPPGQPLPYDPRFGLSKTEYQELLNLSRQLTMKKVGTSILRVKREGRRFIFDVGKSLPRLTGIELNLDTNSVHTPFGIATERIEINASENQRVTGAWNGVMWKLEQLDRNGVSGTAIKFGLGRLTETGRGILYYDAARISDRSIAKASPLVLQYDLPKSRY